MEEQVLVLVDQDIILVKMVVVLVKDQEVVVLVVLILEAGLEEATLVIDQVVLVEKE
jgi:hypothetical protein